MCIWYVLRMLVYGINLTQVGSSSKYTNGKGHTELQPLEEFLIILYYLEDPIIVLSKSSHMLWVFFSHETIKNVTFIYLGILQGTAWT